MQSEASSSRLPASSSSSQEHTTSSLLLSTLSAYSDLTKQLFSSIENPTQQQQKGKTIADPLASKVWNVRDIDGLLAALREVDALFGERIQLAHQHAVNQSKIDALQARAKRRDRETRQAILELSQINSELSEISRLSSEEVASIERSEKQPIGHAALLAYAQRLARYTSAPPGYKLPQVAASTAQTDADGVKKEGGEGEQISLGADYNQYAKRAAAYYDPAIPSMPQEMPFPSDAMMRQGILNSQAMLDGAPMAEQPGLEDGMVEDGDELPANDYGAAYAHLQQQQRQDEDEDAFDLDLN